MTSKSITPEDGECIKLRAFKDFLKAYNTDNTAAATLSGVSEARSNCVTRSNNETYPVTPLELRAEIVTTIWNHLTTKRCPFEFQLALMRAAVEEVERERKDNKICEFKSRASVVLEPPSSDDAIADESQDTLYDLIKLQKFSINILEKLLTRLCTDNAEANNLHRFAADDALCADNACSCQEKQKTSPTTTNDAQTVLAGAVKNKPRKMEDRHCCWPRYSEVFQLKKAEGQYSFYGVFDGHGGPLAAVYAAAQLPQLCAERLTKAESSVSARLAALSDAFVVADKQFARKRISSGTTAVCVLHQHSAKNPMTPPKLFIAWVGDSKAMLVSRTRQKQLVVRPHKPDCEEERLRIESNSGAVMFVQGHWRVNGILNVSRSIGDYSVSSVIAEPDVTSVDIKDDDDFLVLGSDGLWDHVSEQEIVSNIYEALAKRHGENLEELPKQLIDLAKRGDSQDNITVVIVLLRDLTQINGV